MTKELHPRNIHNERYDFSALIKSCKELESFVSKNKHGNLSVDFSNPNAVIALNKALLSHFYKIENWSIPKGHLCPPIPGRADYIHYLADLLAESNDGVIPTGKKIKGLDVGVGANCIYPLIGHSVYGWKFVGSDIDSSAINSAKSIIKSNHSLIKNIKCRFQKNPENIFTNTVTQEDRFDFTLCNPPFHTSKEEADKGTKRKNRNLKISKKHALNFGGQSNELWCPGGEAAFIKRMIKQSAEVKNHCFWFSTLVSKKENLPAIYDALKTVSPVDIRTIEMHQGNKITRIVAWTFLNKEEQALWRNKHWKK